MQDLGCPEAASNTPSCQQETPHSKQLRSIKMRLTVITVSTATIGC